jgi:predicted ATPase
VVDRIIAHADGIPLFIEELTKTVLYTGIRLADDPRNLADPLTPAIVPTTLQASLMARLDRFGRRERGGPDWIGHRPEFSFELLESVSTWPRNDLQEALGELVQAGLATTYGQPPHSTYAFKHALVQDAATPLCYASDAGRFICVWPSCSKKKSFAPKAVCLRSLRGILEKRRRPTGRSIIT